MGNITGKKKVDYDAVRRDLKEMMDDPDWDDGSYAPVLIRLAWHSSGTFDAESGTGGSNGATMRFQPEMGDPENVGLDSARKILEPIKLKHPAISYSDLWILAAYVALEVTGGPVIEFCPGRNDSGAKSAIQPGRLPEAEHGLGEGLDDEGRINGWENLATHIRDVFGRMGFSDREIVALMSGGHMYGRCHPDKSGYNGAWVENPTQFSNEYAADLIEDEWMYVQHDTKVNGKLIPEETRPAEGKRQYMSKWEPQEENMEPASTETYPPGRYKVAQGWINVRKTHLPDSYVIDQPVRDTEFNVVAVRQIGLGVRGQLDVGGWASILATDGEDVLMERVGDLDLSLDGISGFRLLSATYSADDEGIRVYEAAPKTVQEANEMDHKGLQAGTSEIKISELIAVADGDNAFAEIVGKIEDESLGDLNGMFVKIVDATQGAFFERIQVGYNETPRKSIKKLQVKYQMMLPADMVLLWDEEFCKVLKEYAADEELLKTEFGEAYKKLTQLGCPACPAAGLK